MSGMKRYIAWCEDNEYTDEYGEVVSMDNRRLKRQWRTLRLTHYSDL